MFTDLIGNDDIKDALRRLLANGRLPGSLLFTGDAGVGKKLFALEIAKALNCRNRQGVEACDECPACLRISQSTFAGYDKDDSDKKRLVWSLHSDVALARPYNRLIRVDVIRELEREANFRPYEGAARIFIVEDADCMNPEASNALLKTLEEPEPTTHLVLLTANPTALLPTIRSRCQIVRFAPIPASKIEKFLIGRKKVPPADAQLLARLSQGSIGRALTGDLETYRARRESMLGVLSALALTGDRAQLLRLAEELAAAKDREEFEQRLDVLEALIRDAWALALGRPQETIVNDDLIRVLQHIAANLKSSCAASWLTQIEELRAELTVNVNRKIATDALFLSMAAASY
jgi:DNA polymerase-3 subunit delta'